MEQDEELIMCEVCGEMHSPDDMTEVSNGDMVCQSCLDRHYIQCADCGEYVCMSDTTQVANGDYVCENCLADDYGYCEECGEYYPQDETRWVEEYSVYICDDCFNEHYYTCEHCGRVVHEDDVVHNESGEPYCQECYDELYYTCCDCGCEIWHEDVYWSGNEPYCCDCYRDEEGDDDGIYDYHAFNSNNYEPRYAEGEDRYSQLPLYGMELEVGGDTCYASDIVDILNGNAIAMHDSSVDGFELVFMPITRKYLYENLVPVLKKALKFMRDYDFKGHDAGGIHIHFSRLDNSMQVANLARIMYGDEKDRKLWLKITQRKQSSMRWCSMEGNIKSTEYILEHDDYAPAGTSNHGTALNYCTRTNTHELRIFNSNLRLERVLKNFECVFALQDYVKANSEPICDTRGFIQFVDMHSEDYPHLVSFLHEKRVFTIANRFYGDTYISKPKEDDTIEQVTGAIEDSNDVTTDEEIEEMAMAVAG